MIKEVSRAACAEEPNSILIHLKYAFEIKTDN